MASPPVQFSHRDLSTSFLFFYSAQPLSRVTIQEQHEKVDIADVTVDPEDISEFLDEDVEDSNDAELNEQVVDELQVGHPVEHYESVNYNLCELTYNVQGAEQEHGFKTGSKVLNHPGQKVAVSNEDMDDLADTLSSNHISEVSVEDDDLNTIIQTLEDLDFEGVTYKVSPDFQHVYRHDEQGFVEVGEWIYDDKLKIDRIEFNTPASKKKHYKLRA
eukprot:COSAG01_NODE_27828_length_676_cov_0.500867_1_plen_216_part_10